MKLERIIVGPLETNCYLLKKDDKCLIVDPGEEADLIKNNIKEKVVGIIITHYHFDHIGALEELKKYYNCMIYDVNNLKEGINSIDDFSFEIIYTKGHKEDLISIYFKNINSMLVGDFIFENGLGRIDLPGGNLIEMIKSIKNILKYDENIIIYPGHGNKTTLKNEKDNLLEFINYYENLM